MTTPDREQALGGWQMIDTAPEGVDVLVYGVVWAEVGAGSDGLPIAIQARRTGKYWCPSATTYYSLDVDPTHWMPLPPAPDTVSTNEVRDE